MTIVADLLAPATQWTKIPEAFLLASSMNSLAAAKCCEMSYPGMSPAPILMHV